MVFRLNFLSVIILTLFTTPQDTVEKYIMNTGDLDESILDLHSKVVNCLPTT